MACRQRSDLFINLPALQTLDNMLIVRFNFDNSYLLFLDLEVILSLPSVLYHDRIYWTVLATPNFGMLIKGL